MSASWTCLVSDLRTNYTADEVPLIGISMDKRLGDTGTLRGEIPIAAMKRGDPYALTTPGRMAITALRNGRPWWGGIIWTRSYNSNTKRVQIGAGDWWSYYDHRKIVPLIVGDGSDTARLKVEYASIDQNQIARNLVTLAHTHTGGDIGVQLDATTSGILRDRTYYGYELKSVGDALRQLAATEDGPDIMFDVATTLDSNDRPVRVLRVGTPLLGQQGSPHVWEYGGNMLAYTWSSDATLMGTRWWASGDGIEAGTTIAMAEDPVRVADGWALLESSSAYSTVLRQDTLQDHANADQYAGRLPALIVKISANGRQVPFIGEYSPGDDARIVIKDGFLVDGIDTRMRIVGTSLTVGSEVEQPEITLNPVLEGAL